MNWALSGIASAVTVVAGLSLLPEAGAQICCPAGCVQDSNHCVTTGANPTSCPTVACNQGSSGSSGGTSSSGSGVAPFQPVPQCIALQPTPAQVNDATNRCVAALSANAQLLGCLFEDDAGRLEDKRTGLTCPARQAALANQCRARCAKFAQATTQRWCTYEGFQNEMWHDFFGDLGGETVGSARVQDCGAPLPTKIKTDASRLHQSGSSVFQK